MKLIERFCLFAIFGRFMIAHLIPHFCASGFHPDFAEAVLPQLKLYVLLHL